MWLNVKKTVLNGKATITTIVKMVIPVIYGIAMLLFKLKEQTKCALNQKSTQ